MGDQKRAPARPLYDRLMQLMVANGWTTVQLAEKAGIARGTIDNWKDQPRSPLPSTVKSVAERLDIDYLEALQLAGIQAPGPETPRERRDRLYRDLKATPADQPDIEQLARDLLDLRGDPEGMAQLRALLSGTPLEDEEISGLLEGESEREQVRRLARYLKEPGPRGETLRQLLDSWGDREG